MAVLLTKNFHGSLTDINSELRYRLSRGKSNSFIYVVPTKRKLRELQRTFLHTVPGETAPALFLYTLETLSQELYNCALPPKRLVAGPLQAVMMSEALRSLRDSLNYFTPRGTTNNLPQGTLEKLINVIMYLKEHGIYLPALYAEVETAGEDERDKLTDVLKIYETYERLLGATFIDIPGVMKETNAGWNSHEFTEKVSLYFQTVDLLAVSGFDEFSDPEMTMLHHLSEMKNIASVIAFDYHPDNDNIFGHLRQNYRKFLDTGFSKFQSETVEENKFKRHIIRSLFRSDNQSPPLDCRSSVTMMYPEDREHEVEAIAAIIKRLVRHRPGRDLSKICVALYRPQVSTALFREVFARCGIPANITDRFSLDQSPVIVSILSLLMVQQQQFRLSDIMRALSSPYVTFRDSEKPVDAGNLYAIAGMLKIISGRSVWLHRINQRMQVLSQVDVSSELDREEFQRRREMAMLEKGKKDIEFLTRILEQFREPMTPTEFIHRLLSLLQELNVVNCILRHPELASEQVEKDARAYEKFVEFLDEFHEMLLIEGEEHARYSLSYYTERLRSAVSQIRYNVKQKYGYGVYVTSLDETRGLEFEVMIIPGLVDGEFPPVYNPEIFFSSSRRQDQERKHVGEHRYVFYQALTNFTEHLFLSSPRIEHEKELVSSSFLDALQQAIDVEVCGPGELRDRFDGAYSEDDLLRCVGTHIGRNGDEKVIDRLTMHLLPERQQLVRYIRRAIEVERSRENTTHWLEYNGRIEQALNEEARASLEEFRNRIYSVTQLEMYGSCPFKFFAGKVLGLHSTPEVEEGLTPLEKGGILHEILFEFFISRRNRESPQLVECDDRQFNQALDELHSLARRKLDELHISEIFWSVDKELITGSSNRKGILQEVLEHERKRTVEPAPTYFEVVFGPAVESRRRSDKVLTYDQPIIAGNVQLRGKVDRIDVGKNMFTVIDYKTGVTLPGREEIDLGMSLQLPLYLFAVEHILSRRLQMSAAGAAGMYYQLRSPIKEQLGIGNAEYLGNAFNARRGNQQLTTNDAELRFVIAKAVAFVNDYVDNIARGQFPVAPKMPEKTCQHCDFQTICRVPLSSLQENAQEP